MIGFIILQLTKIVPFDLEHTVFIYLFIYVCTYSCIYIGIYLCVSMHKLFLHAFIYFSLREQHATLQQFAADNSANERPIPFVIPVINTVLFALIFI